MENLKDLSQLEMKNTNGGDPALILGGLGLTLVLAYYVGYGVGRLMCE